jgi:hypothetical protein
MSSVGPQDTHFENDNRTTTTTSLNQTIQQNNNNSHIKNEDDESIIQPDDENPSSSLKVDDNSVQVQLTFPSTKRVLFMIIGSGCITIAIICAIVIPLVLRQFNYSSSIDTKSTGTVPADDNNNITNNNTQQYTQTHPERKYQYFSDDVFQYRIEEFNNGIIDGYTNYDEIQVDIWNAAMSELHYQYNEHIESTTRTLQSSDFNTTVRQQRSTTKTKTTTTKVNQNDIQEGDVVVSDDEYGTYRIDCFCFYIYFCCFSILFLLNH